MSASIRSQLHCRIDPELKEWLIEYSQGLGKEIGEVVEDLLVECRQKVTGNSPSMEDKLERQLEQVNDELEELEDMKNRDHVRSRKIAYRLVMQEYLELKHDIPRVRLQALQDFRTSNAAWAKQLSPPVQTESEIIAACRIAVKIDELRAKRKDLETRLRALYGMETESTTEKQTPAEN